MKRFTDDKICALQIEGDNPALWERLLERLTDTILRVAISWCTPSCAQGTCSLLRQHGPLHRRLRTDNCDSVIACYLYIVKKHLPVIIHRYPGETGLTEWCMQSLRALAGNAHRRIDFARTGHTCSRETHLCIPVPRPRVPECLQQAPADQRELYRMVCRGKSAEEIAVALRLPLCAVLERIEALQTLLAEKDWDTYIEMRQRERFKMYPAIGGFAADANDEMGETEPAAAELSVEQKWQLMQVTLVVARWIGVQSAADRELLRLYVSEGRPATCRAGRTMRGRSTHAWKPC